MSTATPRLGIRLEWSVAVAAALLLLPWLGRPALFDRDETYYAEAAREMSAAGNWLVPRLNGQEFHQKPFLPIAVICASYKVFGVDELGARLPSALFGAGTLMLTAAIARKFFGDAAAFRSALVLGSSLLFLLVCRSSMTDSAFLFFFTLALFAFLRATARPAPETPKAGEILGMYAAMGLATLCKGPIGFLLPIAIVFLAAWRDGGWPSLRRLRPIAGIAAILAVAGIGFLALPPAERAAFFRDFLLRENLGRYLAPMEKHGAPFWIYVPVLLVTFLPWSPFLPGAWKSVRERRVRWILGAWFAVPFVFFSAAATKLPHYLLPVFPALAILVGAGWDARNRGWRFSAPLILLLPLSAVFPVALLIARRRWPDLLPVSLVWTAAVLSAGALAALLAGRRPKVQFGVLAASMLVFIWMTCGWSLPTLDEVRLIRPIGLRLREVGGTTVFTYRFLEPGLLFYAQRTMEKLETPEQVTGRVRGEKRFAILTREEDLAEVQAAAQVPLKILLRRRGFCEDSGPLDLVILAR